MKRSMHLIVLTPTVVTASCLLMATTAANAFERYKDDDKTSGSNCSQCHGDFDGSRSPQGTVFPSGDKHLMHVGSNNMNTDCDLCHTTGDDSNPFLDSSNGTSNNSGLGCNGCHNAEGLRAHHLINGVSCAGCHPNDAAPPSEGTMPPYYGTADTEVDNPCNTALVSDTNENWSVGDFLGLDNDGDNLYDLADFDCGPPYRILSLTREGADMRVVWETVGGRTDAIQAASAITAGYSDVSPGIANPGVGLITTNFLDVGGATNEAGYYRVRYAP